MADFNLQIIANEAVFQDQWAARWQEINRINKGYELLSNGLSIPQDAFLQLDRNAIDYQYRVDGGDIVEDLNSLIVPINVGKTLNAYTKVGEISDGGSISMDGHTPNDYDHVAYSTDGDPVPVFSDGFGANWRHVAGFNTIQVDVLVDSQNGKAHRHAQKIANYVMVGSENINEQGFEAKGLKNHKNTFKIDLSASGVNVNLMTADITVLSDFFHKTFKTILDNHHVKVLDVLWVSPEIYQNLTTKMAAVKGDFGDKGASIMEYLGTSIPVKGLADIKVSYALKGNEFLGYVRDRRYIRIPVGMPTTIIPLERKTYKDNYNFDMDTIRGINIIADAGGKCGVFYGAELS